MLKERLKGSSKIAPQATHFSRGTRSGLACRRGAQGIECGFLVKGPGMSAVSCGFGTSAKITPGSDEQARNKSRIREGFVCLLGRERHAQSESAGVGNSQDVLPAVAVVEDGAGSVR